MKLERHLMAAAWALIAAFSLSGVQIIADEATELPRYKFAVGQELTYESNIVFGNPVRGTKKPAREKWTFWIVDENADGSYRVVAVKDNTVQNQFRYVAWFDIFPNGRIVPNHSLGYCDDPSQILARLPSTEEEVKTGWKVSEEKQGSATRFSSRPAANPDHFEFTGKDESIFVKLSETERESVYQFDLDRGLVEKIEISSRETKRKTTETIELMEATMRTPEWPRQLLADARSYFEIGEEYDNTHERRDLKPDDFRSELERLQRQLAEAAAAMKSDEIRDPLIRQAGLRLQVLPLIVEQEVNRQSQIGMTAFDFEAEDFTGKKLALADHRGKVIILDFWYRYCGPCLMAMPQVKQVAAHFADRPVIVFGMNTDEEESNATFVIEKMQLNYTNLKARDLKEKYSIAGHPTLLIIDQEGIVRDVYMGFSPTMKDQVIETVEQLLKSAPE